MPPATRLPLPDTPNRRVRLLTSTLARLHRVVAAELSESELAGAVDEIDEITTLLARADAADMDEARAKMSVLRRRLIETLDASSPGEALTLALAASVLADLDRLAA